MLVVKVHTIGKFYVYGLLDQQIYGHTEHKGLIEYWKYDIRYGVYLTIDQAEYSTVTNHSAFISTRTMRLEELSLLRILLEDDLTSSQLLQELKIKGFDKVETIRYHSGGYELSGDVSWDDVFRYKGYLEIENLVESLVASGL